ncbi:MAG TPA: hypothetical protein VGI03_00990 [Verrucomicrobiae bacterium]|jgi:hypothetical protein
MGQLFSAKFYSMSGVDKNSIIVPGYFAEAVLPRVRARMGVTLFKCGKSLDGLAGDFELSGVRIEKTCHPVFRAALTAFRGRAKVAFDQ